MAYKSNLPFVIPLVRRCEFAGLIAAAQVPFGIVRARIFKGFTSGDYVQGGRGLAGRVMVTDPFYRAGVSTILIGTSKAPGYPYELAWELGHNNTFTRRYERQEVWRPALMNHVPRITSAYANGWRAEWRRSGGGG